MGYVTPTFMSRRRAVLTSFGGPGPAELMGPSLPPPFPAFPPLSPPLSSS